MNTIHLIVLSAGFLFIVNGHLSDNDVALNVVGKPEEPFSSSRPGPGPPLCIPCTGVNTDEDQICERKFTGCYCIISQQLSWLQALQFCKNNGKQLLHISTPAIQADMSYTLPSLIMDTNNKYPKLKYIVDKIGLWTSGTYLKDQGTFVWAATPTPGTPFDFTQWQLGSPKNTQSTNNCVRLIIFDGNSINNWSDLDCGQYLPFICHSAM